VQGARLADVMHDSCERSADDAADSFVLSVPPSGIGDKCTLRKKLSVVIAMIPFFISFSGSIVCHLFAHGCVASAHFHILLAFLKLVFYNTFLKLLLLHFTFSNLCIVFFQNGLDLVKHIKEILHPTPCDNGPVHICLLLCEPEIRVHIIGRHQSTGSAF
jgi:hypothetical protein